MGSFLAFEIFIYLFVFLNEFQWKSNSTLLEAATREEYVCMNLWIVLLDSFP